MRDWRGVFEEPASLDHGVLETFVEDLVAGGAEGEFDAFVVVVGV